MPGEATTAGANVGLDAMTGRATATARTTYLALATAAVSDTTTPAQLVALEPSVAGTNGYARQAVTWGAPTGDPSSSSNTNALTFGPAGTDWAACTHAALVDSLTGTPTTVLFWWQLGTPGAPNTPLSQDAAIGGSITFAAGTLTATLD